MPANALRLCVAPMMEWTDRHCRVFHRLLAPDARLYTEMVHAQAVIHGDRDRLLGFDPVEHPLALQLGGSDPADLARACVIATERGYDEINLNVGCPSDRVQAGRFGACLMREPGLVADCVAGMATATPVPVTVKCRLGVDELEDYDYFRGFIDTVAQAGCSVFIVHARKAWLSGLSPKQNREIPPLRHDWAWRLKRERPDLQVVINGGLVSVEDVHGQLPQCDGVMIGRAAYHEPYVMHRLQQALFTPEQPLRTREAVLHDMRPYIDAHLAAGGALKHVARHLMGLFHGEFGGRAFRQVLSQHAYRTGAGWEVIEQALEPTRRQPREAA